MFRFQSWSKSWVPVLFSAVCFGCGGVDGPDREPISGRVTLDGQPLKKGFVTFIPTASNPEWVVSALVIDGEYTLSREEGPTQGSHRVDIWSREATGKLIKDRNDPENPIAVTREMIPSRYNVDSRLAADVKPGSGNRFDFELASTRVALKSKR